MSDWTPTTIGKAFDVNPDRRIEKGAETVFVPMDALGENNRDLSRFERRQFTGSGSKFRNGDTLLARITPCLENGKTAFVSGLEEGAVAHGSTEFIVISGRDGISDGLFGYYLTRSPQFRADIIGKMEGTSGRQRVPQKAVEDYPVLLPSPKEQLQIAEVLGRLDDKITLNRRLGETLEAIAQALFQSWFVDFDPVRAKASGEDPDAICQRLGLTRELLALFPDRLIESELGEIPAEWDLNVLGDVIDVFDSKRVPLSNRERENRKGEFPYYGAASVMDYVDDYLFDGVFVLMGEDGSVVNSDGTPILQYVWGKFWVNNHAHVLQAKPPMSNEQLLLFLRRTNIAALVTGAVQAKLSQGNLKRIPYVQAPDLLNQAFGNLVASKFELIRSLSDECRTLEAARNTLLPKLLAGTLAIPVEAKHESD